MAKDPTAITYTDEQLAEHEKREARAAKFNKKIELPLPEPGEAPEPPPAATLPPQQGGATAKQAAKKK